MVAHPRQDTLAVATSVVTVPKPTKLLTLYLLLPAASFAPATIITRILNHYGNDWFNYWFNLNYLFSNLFFGCFLSHDSLLKEKGAIKLPY
jgi:hypothetical protein